MNLTEFRGLPECKKIQEMQYRVMVKPGKKLETRLEKETNKTDSLSTAGKITRVEPIFQYIGPRQPYEIANIAQLSVQRELIVGVKMKDIFSNKRAFISSSPDAYGELDQRVFVDFFGWGPSPTRNKYQMG